MGYVVIFVLIIPFIVYLLRQVYFTFYVYSNQRSESFIDTADIDLPTVTVLSMAHNEESVIQDLLNCLLVINYPKDKYQIMVVNDRSSDRTGDIIDRFVHENPSLVRVIHRYDGDLPGKAAAMQDAVNIITSDIIVVFDADYLPGPDLVRKLVHPFSEPTVGATMGVVMPCNYDKNLLTRIIDIERQIGYMIDQQARQLLSLMPQYGGTVGAIRMSALCAIGGMNVNALAEDTDLTIRMYLSGWKVEYLNHASCLEESVEQWHVRFRQLQRWSMGHTQCMKYIPSVIRSKVLTGRQKFDGCLLLSFYMLPILYVFTIFLNITSFYVSQNYTNFISGPLVIFFIISTTTILSQILLTSRNHTRSSSILYIPLMSLSFLFGIYTVISGFVRIIKSKYLNFNGKSNLNWYKTIRFRKVVC